MICGDIYDLITIVRQSGVFVQRFAGFEHSSLQPASQRDMKETIKTRKINKTFNLNHPSDLFSHYCLVQLDH